MWAVQAGRKTLLDLLGRQPSLPPVEKVLDPKRLRLLESSDELLLIWGNEPVRSADGSLNGEQLPEAIVVRPDQTRELIAWITTVAGGYRPFTAFVRIIDPEVAQHAIEPKLPSLNRFEDSAAGLIIAEALTLSAAQRSVSGLSLLPCQSTYSYSFARAFALGYMHNGKDPIAAPFGLAKRLTRQPPRRVPDEVLSTTLRVLSGLAAESSILERSLGVPPFIWETCRELQFEREVKRSWHLLSDAGVLPQQSLDELRGPREHRVKAFERILQSPDRMDALTASFLAGLLADQIAPGTFEHVDLLLPYLNRYPTALLWYGLCAGLHRDSEVQQVGNCLGRRLVRDLLIPDPILSRPKYDLSVDELQVHLDREEPLDFRTASQNHVSVELLPGVPAYMKWPVTGESLAGPPRGLWSAPQSELPLRLPFSEGGGGSTSAERQAAISDLTRAVERVKLILKELPQTPDTVDRPEGKRRKRL